MKKLTLILFSLAFYFQASSQTGIGLRIGEPYGLTIKSFINDNFAIDITLGGNHFGKTFSRQTDGLDWGGPTFMINFLGQGDLLRGSDVQIYGGAGMAYHFVKYTGGGSAVTGTLTEHRIYLTVAGGLEYITRGNLGLFAEVTPGLELTPRLLGFSSGFGLGFRAYF
jgi:hypothetical protein